MRILLKVVFILLFLWSSAFAVESHLPHVEGRQENISITPVQLPAGQSENLSDEALRVKLFDRSTYYYPYRQELELHAGAVYGVQDSSDDPDEVNEYLGFSYMLPRLESPKWIFGADLSLVGHGHVHVSRRHIRREKSAFRPFYQYGLLQKFVPEEKFASLSNWENYLLRLSVGFAVLTIPPGSAQLELAGAIGAEDTLVMLTLGYVWGF